MKRMISKKDLLSEDRTCDCMLIWWSPKQDNPFIFLPKNLDELNAWVLDQERLGFNGVFTVIEFEVITPEIKHAVEWK